MGVSDTPIGRSIRHWRHQRKISQLSLALEADISTRHLSFIETGKSHPSRKVVLRLASALRLPLRQQNLLLVSAGYAPEYGTTPIDAPQMALVRFALERIIRQHEPYPALVVNSGYDILLANQAVTTLLNMFVEPANVEKYRNLYHLVFEADGLRPYFSDWATVSAFLITRLREEALATQNQAVQKLLDELPAHTDTTDRQPDRLAMSNPLPILSFELKKGTLALRFFSTMTTFGSPQDVTAQELRIEMMFPADAKTAQALQRANSKQ